MKPDIHPNYGVTQVTCSCGNTFTTRSTAPNGVIHAESCSVCHPFYTGKQRVLDTEGRVAKFQQKYARAAKQAGTKPATKSAATKSAATKSAATKSATTKSAATKSAATKPS